MDDYYFGYPTILDGENAAPPEDVGGPPGYEEFLKVYHNPKHPEYETIREWAEQAGYSSLDLDRINDSIKYIKYKKTEWDQINHENHVVLEDKYRGSK